MRASKVWKWISPATVITSALLTQMHGEGQMEGFVIWAYEQYWHVLASRFAHEVAYNPSRL